MKKNKIFHVSNASFKCIKNESEWVGNKKTTTGEFINLSNPFQPKWLDVLKWKTTKNEFSAIKKKQKTLPIIKNDTSFINHKKDVIVWLGHSSFFIRINGISILTDPVFGNLGFFLKRSTPFPFDKNVLPKIDYLLLSHDHRDHLDIASLRFLFNRKDKPIILTGLEMDKWLEKQFPNAAFSCQAVGWYQQYSIEHNEMNIYFLPARHWSKRGLFDTNKRLWGSFLIQFPNITIYFSGDTGYDDHLKEVGILFPNIDIAIIGIGAYEPQWFMSANHISPKNALKAVQEMGAKQLIPMHYGTFDLSNEPVWEPLSTLEKMHAMGYSDIKLNILKIGENLELD